MYVHAPWVGRLLITGDHPDQSTLLVSAAISHAIADVGINGLQLARWECPEKITPLGYTVRLVTNPRGLRHLYPSNLFFASPKFYCLPPKMRLGMCMILYVLSPFWRHCWSVRRLLGLIIGILYRYTPSLRSWILSFRILSLLVLLQSRSYSSKQRYRDWYWQTTRALREGQTNRRT